MLRNAPFVGGYALDLRSMPDAWWPQNRIFCVFAWRGLAPSRSPLPRPRLRTHPGVIGPALAQVGEAYVCWAGSHAPSLAPAWWAPSGSGEIAAWLPPRGLPGPPAPAAGALVVEYHHPYRASRMNGVSLHGRVEPEAGAQAALASAIEQRYGVRPAGGALFGCAAERITSWLGFDVRRGRIRTRPKRSAAPKRPRSTTTPDRSKTPRLRALGGVAAAPSGLTAGTRASGVRLGSAFGAEDGGVQPLETLFDASDAGPALPNPELARLYGGGLTLPGDVLYANFVRRWTGWSPSRERSGAGRERSRCTVRPTAS